MRVPVVVLLLASLLTAGTPKELIDELVPLLGADDPSLRDDAARRIFALGEGSIPALEKLRPHDPEIARAVRALIRRTKTLKLHIVAPSGVQHIGSPLKLEAHLVNNTDETFLVGLTTASKRGHGTMSGFLLKVKGKPAVRLRPDQVELIAPQGKRQLILEPEDMLSVAIKLQGKDLPLRRPGDIELSIIFDGFVARPTGRRHLITREHVDVIVETFLETSQVTIRARGRKPEELDAALRSRDGKTFQSALAELMLREDDAVLVVLRRHIGNPFLRVRAILRIGAAANEDDLELLRAVAGSPQEQIEARIAAIQGLGNYKHRKARTKLVLLAFSARLRNAAVKALTKYKHAGTIDCFLRLLQRRYHEGQWTKDALATILKWTNRHVDNRRGEIDAFERWWRENRREWIKANR